MSCRVALVVICLAGSCESQEPAVPASSTVKSEADGSAAKEISGGKSVGDPCELTDGFVPSFPECPKLDGPPPAIPVNCVKVDGGPVESTAHLPPGIGYCLQESTRYPYGYFTMNCATDVDCPATARCFEGLCYASCQSDDQCSAPTTCFTQHPVPHCACTTCPPPPGV